MEPGQGESLAGEVIADNGSEKRIFLQERFNWRKDE